MRKHTIIAINGLMCAGKTTICKALSERLKDYIHVDRAYLKNTMLKPLWLHDRQLARYLSKKATIDIIQGLMPHGYNIIVQELRLTQIEKHFGRLIKKHNYRVKGFYLECSVEEAIKRDIVRKTRVTTNHRAPLVRRLHKEYPGHDAGGIVINTEKTTLPKTIALILKEIQK